MTGRSHPIGVVAEFLREALARGALGVPELEARARAAGLLVERQRITHAKAFKKAKKSLGIRSVRDGFGAGRWLWQLPEQCAVPIADPAALLSAGPDGDIHAEVPSGPGHSSQPAADDRIPTERRIPLDWIEGVARLDTQRAPTDIPRHRWRQFSADCHNFLASPWAERAAALGWDAAALFGCHRNHSSAGLLWAMNGGGRLIELHRDWAVIELAANGPQRTFDRRRVDAAKVTLPWIGLRQRSVS